jgi:hypothetical protein
MFYRRLPVHYGRQVRVNGDPPEVEIWACATELAQLAGPRVRSAFSRTKTVLPAPMTATDFHAQYHCATDKSAVFSPSSLRLRQWGSITGRLHIEQPLLQGETSHGGAAHATQGQKRAAVHTQHTTSVLPWPIALQRH